MDPWISQNNLVTQTVLSAACFVAGLVLAIGFRNFTSSGGNARAGFLLGVFLLILGATNVLLSGKQTIVVDPHARRVTVKDSYLFRTRERSIAFWDVVDVRIGYLGKKSNFVTRYYLVLRLSKGERYALFSPGRFYPGGSDKRNAGLALLAQASRCLDQASPVVQYPLPRLGRTRFYFLTLSGVLSAEASEDDLGNRRHALSPLFHKGHDVITQIRLWDEANRRKT